MPRLTRVGTTTRKPFAASRRANCDSAGDAGGQARNLLRRLVRVGQRNDVARDLPLRLQQQALAVDAFQDRPADLESPKGVALGDKGRKVVVAESLHPRRQAWVDDPDDPPERLAVRLDGLLVGQARRGSRSQSFARAATDASIRRSAKRCRPSSIALERSRSPVSGRVPGKGAASSPLTSTPTFASRRAVPTSSRRSSTPTSLTVAVLASASSTDRDSSTVRSKGIGARREGSSLAAARRGRNRTRQVARVRNRIAYLAPVRSGAPQSIKPRSRIVSRLLAGRNQLFNICAPMKTQDRPASVGSPRVETSNVSARTHECLHRNVAGCGVQS